MTGSLALSMAGCCPHCGAPVPFAVDRHVRDCEKIVLGLLGGQVTPEVEQLPEGWVYPFTEATGQDL